MAFPVMPSCALRPRLTRKPGRLLQSSLALARRRRGAAPWFVPSARALPRLLGVPGRHHPRLCRSSLLPRGRASQKASCSCEATVMLSLPSSSPSSVTTGTRGPSPRALPQWFLPRPGTARLGRGGLSPCFSFSPVSGGYTSVEYSIMLGEKGEGRCGRELSELGGNGEVWKNIQSGNRAFCRK